MANSNNSGELVTQYSQRSGVHMDRFMLLIRKHIDTLYEWVELVKNNPVDSPQFASEVYTLWKNSKDLGEQFSEVIQDIADDNVLLIQAFAALQEERKEEKK